MPATPPNKFLRIVVPIIVGVVMAFVGWAFFMNTATQPGQQPAPSSATMPPTTAPEIAAAPTASAPSPPGDDIDPGAKPAPSDKGPSISAAPAATPTPNGTPGAPLTGLRARTIAAPAAAPSPIGDLGVGSAKRALVTFTWNGAGVESITMAEYFDTIAHKLAKDPQGHYEIQRKGAVAAGAGTFSVSSLAARAAIIDGQFIDLYSTKAADGSHRFIWREVSPGTFQAEIVSEGDAPIARITRTYEQRDNSFEFNVRQTFENLSGRELALKWIQYGPIDLREEFTGYRIDVRRLRFGYLLDAIRDPSQTFVQADGNLTARDTVLKTLAAQAAAGASADQRVWPDPPSFKGAGRLSWIAQTSRYFSFAIHPLIDPAAANPERALTIAAEAYAVMIGQLDPSHPNAGTARLAIELHSPSITIAPSAAQDLSFAVYAGPLARSELTPKTDKLFETIGLRSLVIFNLGGMCAFCTWQWLANLLFDYLHLLHDWIVFDWAIAIMLLVVTVRTILHPITKRSQIAMTRFGKQMQALAPKQKKIQELYKNDPAKMKTELARLMQEEKVNYAGALGCLPMFLQTPIWIALYAMLYFAFELRHEAAYFGVFQAITAGKWTFLADLSSPDRFVTFGGASFHIPLLSGLMGDIASFNILPILLGVVFFIQQKYLTPPSATALTPEQEMQQKMMKWMMVVMFPLMMYNAPSGLAIYFITNSTLGILESRYIRAHIDQLDKNPPPPGGAGSGPGFLGRKKVANTAANPYLKNREEGSKGRFKERE